MVTPELLRMIRRQYRLSWDGLHGVSHWARVCENGERLAEVSGANIDIIRLFAVFHDACRRNEDFDPEHGRRGAELASAAHGKLYSLPDDHLKLLLTACSFHTEHRTHLDITVQTCWDADRLDLLRVGIKPQLDYLNTPLARSDEFIAWASERAARLHRPIELLTAWDASVEADPAA